MAVVSRLERTGARARGRVDCRRRRERAATRELDHHVHGRGVRLHPAVLPVVPAWRGLRQADGGQRLGRCDRAVDDGASRTAARDTRGRARRCARDLWRRKPVRCVLRACPNGPGTVSCGGCSESPDARGDSARHVDVHDVRAARHTRDPECDSNAVLRYHAVRRTGSRHRRLGDHAGHRPVVARACGTEGAFRG